MKGKKVKKIVKDRYSIIAKRNSSCSCSCSSKKEVDIGKSIGYNIEEISSFSDANMGLGCGNPTALGEIKHGETVLDLGSGPGLDCFLAAKKTGKNGHVIGVDMTNEMINKARENAKKYNFKNVEFRLGDIESIPVENSSIDVVISNCVINLAPDKLKVFKEAYRVLKNGGRLYVSDIVLLENLSEEQRDDPDLLAGCVAGALLKEDYLRIIKNAGFTIRNIIENREISRTQYQGIPLESLSITAYK